jgi:hypothetical protein
MADPIIRLKRSGVEGKIPTPDQLPTGEIALNTFDGKLYASKNVGVGTTVFAVNPWSVGTGTDTYNTYFTVGNVGVGTTIPTVKLDIIGDGKFSGIVTATTFSGQVNAGVGTITTLSGTTVSYSTGNFDTGYIVTGVTTNFTSTNGSITNLTGTAATITTLSSTNGNVTNLTGTAGTITTLSSTNGNVTNLTGTAATITTLSGTTVSYSTGNFNNGYIVTGVTTNFTSTNGLITNLTGTAGTITTLSGTTGNFVTGYIVTGVTTNLTSTNLTTQQLNVSGVSTLSSTTLIGGGTATGTASQPLQVTGGAYVSGNIGVGTTNPTSNLTVVGNVYISGVSTFKGNVNLADNTNLYLGDGNDLRIFHNSFDSFIQDVGTGNLFIDASNTYYRAGTHFIQNSSSSENLAIFTSNGSVALYYDNSKKFETSGVGATVYGTVDATQLNISGISTLTSTLIGGGTLTGTASQPLQVTGGAYVSGNIGVGTTNPSQKLDVDGNIKLTGAIYGPSELVIDPSAVGDNTGSVRIKGDLYVDGTQTYINSSTIELADFNVGIATTVGTNLLLDGAGISIGATDISKTITWNNSAGSLTSSEDWNLVSGKQYEINGTPVLDSTTLGSGVVNSSLTLLGTLGQLNVSGVSTFAGITTVTGSTLFAKQLNVSGVVTATSFYGNGNTLTGIAASEGKVYYVNSIDGSDSNSGKTLQKPFATIAQALSVAISGDTVKLGAGTFTEAFPLTIPQGVHIVGMGIRSSFIQPTGVTKQNDCFLLNGDTTVEDLTIGNFFEPGVGFKFANGAKTLNRSPYIQRVTVLNKGSVTSVSDPYGFDTAHNPPTTFKAGRGALIDGSVVDAETLEPAMLFNESTFICPNNIALEMTNGARSEWVNCFTYFADKAIYAHDGAVGLGSTGYVRVKTSGITTGTTPQANDELYYLESNSISGSYSQVGTALTITRVGHGLTVGDRIFADFTSGTATDGFYRVTGYVGINTFSVTMAGSATTSGNVSYKEALGFGTVRNYDTSAGLSSITGKGEGLFQLPTERSGKTVTAYGDAQLSTTQKKFGTASLYLDGTGDYARCEGGTDFAFSGDFAAECWIYPTSVTGNKYLFSLGTETTGRYNLALVSGVLTGNFYGSASTTFGGSISTNTWSHIALVRSGSTISVYVDGTALGTTETNSSAIGNTGQLTIGADTSGANTFSGYIDEVRISNISRYTGTFTPATTQFNSDGSDKLLLHFDGITASTSFTDSSVPTQDIRWVRSGVGIATATRITLADYQQFGAEMRSIGSAAVFGNTGITAEGPGSTLRLFAFNFGHIGSGKDFSQDISLVNQENEVITSDNGRVYFVSIDQSGDFRVGDAFYVNQEEGTVNFGGQDFTLNSLSDLNVTDGTNTSTLTPTTLTVGNIQLSGNDVTTTSGDLIINPSGISSTRVEGNLTVIGDINTTTDVKINGTSVLTTAQADAVALAIALG